MGGGGQSAGVTAKSGVPYCKDKVPYVGNFIWNIGYTYGMQYGTKWIVTYGSSYGTISPYELKKGTYEAFIWHHGEGGTV